MKGLLKRLKNIEGKNEQQLDAIKDQGKKQLDAIKNDKIVYLKDEINKLFEMYPKSLDSPSKSLLKTLAENEDRISCKNLSYKTYFPDSTFHIINFLKKYGTLSSLLEGLVTRKVTVNNANADQISFIINIAWT